MSDRTNYPPVNACLRLIEEGVITSGRQNGHDLPIPLLAARLRQLKMFDTNAGEGHSIWLSGKIEGRATTFEFPLADSAQRFTAARDAEMARAV